LHAEDQPSIAPQAQDPASASTQDGDAAPADARVQTHIENRECVLALQGGGIYGLTMVGQAKAVIEDHGYRPRVLAGNSAGAIVASLLWAGLAPSEIESRIIDFTEEHGTLEALFGPFESADTHSHEFYKLGQLDTTRRDLTSILRTLFGRSGSLLNPVQLGRLIVRGFRQHQQLKPMVGKLGLFSGATLERTLDGWYRSVPDMPDWIREKPPAELLTFGDFQRVFAERPGEQLRAPLLLTSTNLSYRRLEIFNSIDPRHANIPVARAVRASAGFPGFLRPVSIPQAPEGGEFADGGLISNYPIWVFSHVLRQLSRESDHVQAELEALIRRPLIRFGLRVVDPRESYSPIRSPSELLHVLGGLITGTARRQLEDYLADQVPRLLEIQQPTPTTGGPDHLLDAEALDSKAVKTMIRLGREHASVEIDALQRPEILDPQASSDIQELLGTLAQRAADILEMPPETIRTNIFVPDGLTLDLRHLHNMPEAYRGLRWPSLSTGLTGFAYWYGTGYLCNLDKLRTLERQDPELFHDIFGDLSAARGLPDLGTTFLASIPIFDPHEARLADTEQADAQGEDWMENTYAQYFLEPIMTGPRLGVLSIEATLDYKAIELADDPIAMIDDERIQALMTYIHVWGFAIARRMVDHRATRRYH
jgi:predicted acylesterase/phospholipase RssA